MTRERLEQYRCIVGEIGELREELQERCAVADTVSGSLTRFPYTRHTVRVEGLDPEGARFFGERLLRKAQELEEEREAVERFLDGVEDSDLRRAVRLRFLRGLTWRQTAARLGPGWDEELVKKRVYRYLRQTEKEEKGCTTSAEYAKID